MVRKFKKLSKAEWSCKELSPQKSREELSDQLSRTCSL